MLSRIIPKSRAGRIAYLMQLPSPLIFLWILTTAHAFRGPMPVIIKILWFLYLTQFLVLGYKLNTTELRLQGLRQPRVPRLWASTGRSTALVAVFFAFSFSVSFILLSDLYPKLVFLYHLLICLYFAVASGLLAGFFASAADDLLAAGIKL